VHTHAEKPRRSNLVAATALCLVFVWVLAPSPAWGQATETPPKDLTGTSLEDLMNVEVTSASKKEQKLSQVAAAAFVITQDDIRQSGATNIPDLLRIVPGLDVGQINGSTWAIGARGLNQQFSTKLLVMIDGRIVYTPNFGGVYWDTADLPLADIDRIEVILGPGGSTWGANAVNGIISIITKHAADTHGGIVEAAGGNILQEAGMVQYGGEIQQKVDYRAYVKYFNEGQERNLEGNGPGADGWHMLRGGFRTDTQLDGKDTLMVEGDVYTGREGELGFYLPSVTSPTLLTQSEEISLGGGFLQADWHRQYSERSDSDLQVSYTGYTRRDPLEPETRNTVDIEFQQHFAWGQRQDFVWGADYRGTGDSIGGSFTVYFDPSSKWLNVFSTFAQDEITVIPDRLHITVGSKFEWNDYTGFEIMPTARAAWNLSKQQMVWGAISRALRTPTRNDTSLVVNLGSSPGPGGIPVVQRFQGNLDFQNEELIAYEAGYRTMLGKRVSLDLAAYYNDYNHLTTTEPNGLFLEPTPPPPHEVQLTTYQNLLYGETHGFEISLRTKLTDWWELVPGYAFSNRDLHLRANSQDTQTVPFMEGNSPDNMAELRSHMNLGRGISWDANAYYVGPLTNQGPASNVRIPGYVRLDTGLSWSPWESVTLSVFGQNLVKEQHLEFDDIFGSMQSGQMRRSAYAKLAWRF
jgi:iron complex outermembrane recepter protein